MEEQMTDWRTVERRIGERLQTVAGSVARHALVLLAMVAVLWAIELVDLITPRSTLDWYGIHPRTLAGLRNILFAPLLHAGFGHLLANTLPLLVLGFLILVRSRQDFVSVTLAALLASGLGVWLFGESNTVHVGASLSLIHI